MQKNYENNPEKANVVKQSLQRKYPELFQKYEMEELAQLQVCNLAEFFLKEHPEKYDKTAGTRMNYENNKELTRIYAVIEQEKNRAIMINVNKEGKIPEGEFGVYDLQNHKFQLTNEEVKTKIKQELQKNIEQYAENIYSPKQIREMTEQMMPKTLDDMDKLATQGEKAIHEKAERLVKVEKPNEINRENGKTESQRMELEEESRTHKGQQEDTKEVPEDVAKACMKLGITELKGYFYVDARQLSDKVDNVAVNENGGKVLMLETANTSDAIGPDRYFGVQDERMVLYGTQDREVEEVTNRGTIPPVDGKLVEPLKKDNPTYIEFSNAEGMYVKEKLEENMNLSVQDLENYKKEVEELLENYSAQVYRIEDKFLANNEEKARELSENNLAYDRMNVELAKKYGIDRSDVKSINLQTTEYTEDRTEKLRENLDDEELQL